jgi:hypothetical protein
MGQASIACGRRRRYRAAGPGHSAGSRTPFAWYNSGMAYPEASLPKVTVALWRSDAIVLFDWLMRTELDDVPISHPAQKQALMDLLTRLETETDVPYGKCGKGLTSAEIETAQAEVAKDMGW